MGRLPLHRLPRRRRGRAGQPQREAAHALLPRTGRGTPPRAPEALRARRRDRDRRASGSRVRRAVPAHPSGREAHPPAGRVDARLVRGLRPVGAQRSLLHGDAIRAAARRPREAAGQGAAARPPHPGHRRPRRGGGLVLPLRGGGARRRGGQGRRSALPARQARHGQGQAPAHGRLRGGGLPHPQGRGGRGLAAARPFRRRGNPAPRRGGLGVQRGPPQRAGGRARALPEGRAGGPPLGRAGPTPRRAAGHRVGRTVGTPART